MVQLGVSTLVLGVQVQGARVQMQSSSEIAQFSGLYINALHANDVPNSLVGIKPGNVEMSRSQFFEESLTCVGIASGVRLSFFALRVTVNT